MSENDKKKINTLFTTLTFILKSITNVGQGSLEGGGNVVQIHYLIKYFQ